MDYRDKRHRIVIELSPETKEEIDKLPHGIKGKVLAGICDRLAREIERTGWEHVLWLSHARFDFLEWKKEDKYS